MHPSLNYSVIFYGLTTESVIIPIIADLNLNLFSLLFLCYTANNSLIPVLTSPVNLTLSFESPLANFSKACEGTEVLLIQNTAPS